MRLIIDIPEEVKQTFDNAKNEDLYGNYYDRNSLIGKAIQNGIPIPDNATNEFYVIDKRTGKEPIFDFNHIFKEKWFKESGLIWCDIDGWYISEYGTLALVDDCGRVAYPPIDRFDIVYDEPTVCDIDTIRNEIEEELASYKKASIPNWDKVDALAYALDVINRYKEV